jgi:hypothetical protein
MLQRGPARRRKTLCQGRRGVPADLRSRGSALSTGVSRTEDPQAIRAQMVRLINGGSVERAACAGP